MAAMEMELRTYLDSQAGQKGSCVSFPVATRAQHRRIFNRALRLAPDKIENMTGSPVL